MKQLSLLDLLHLAPHFYYQMQQSSFCHKLRPSRLSEDQKKWWTSLADLVKNNNQSYIYIVHNYYINALV